MNRIVKSFKCGGSTVLPLTDFIELNEEYFIHDENDKVIIEKFKK